MLSIVGPKGRWAVGVGVGVGIGGWRFSARTVSHNYSTSNLTEYCTRAAQAILAPPRTSSPETSRCSTIRGHFANEVDS